MAAYYGQGRLMAAYYVTTGTCTTTTTTGDNWVTSTSTSTSCSSNTAVACEPPPYRRPKPPYIPFEPVRIPRYRAPFPPSPWPVALRRFRGDLV